MQFMDTYETGFAGEPCQQVNIAGIGRAEGKALVAEVVVAKRKFRLEKRVGG